jgi:murein DD-endopeptidase MepM/ murein hydrolase activator NlpD
VTRILLLAIIGGTLLVPPPAGAIVNLDAEFVPIRSAYNPIWPVQTNPPQLDPDGYDHITAPFGPRIDRGNGRYDFHRGIDIRYPLGTSVVAPLEGELIAIYNAASPYNNPFGDGGTTVVLRHRARTHTGATGSVRGNAYFYSYYMHLSGYSPTVGAADGTLPRPSDRTIAKGTVIGWVGQTGRASYPHLHWEVRVGSQCQLETQVAGTCTWIGLDPAVQPLLLLPPAPQPALAIDRNAADNPGDVRFSIATNDDYPVLNRVEIELWQGQPGVAGSTLSRSHLIDFDTREGIIWNTRPTATEISIKDQLDRVNLDRDPAHRDLPHFEPLGSTTLPDTDIGWGFNTREEYKTVLLIPAAYIGTNRVGLWVRVKATDLNELAVTIVEAVGT